MVVKLCEPEIIRSLLLDMYGNYVIQKALSVAKEPYYIKYIRAIVPIIDKLNTVSFGPKLYNKLINSYREIGQLVDHRNMIKMSPPLNQMQMNQIKLNNNLQNIQISFNTPQKNNRRDGLQQQINNFYFNN